MHRIHRLAALLLGALGAVACVEEEGPTEVTARAERGALVFSGSWYGELQARDSQPISAPELSSINGFTVETVLPDGTQVKKGEVVMTFVRGPIEDDLRAREAELAVAEAELRRTEQGLSKERIDLELEVQRREKALDRSKLAVVEGVNLISKLELDRAKLDVQRAEIELDLARKALRAFAQKRDAALQVQRLKVQAVQDKVNESREQLGKMELHAPGDGVIYAPYTRLNWVRARVEPGRVVRPGDRVLEIPDLSRFVAHIYVRQRDATLLREGDPATLIPTAIPDHPIQGRILRKESFATTRNERLDTETPEGSLKELLVVVELDESLPQLRPGGTVRADINATLAEDVLRIPLAAVVERGRERLIRRPGGAEVPIKIGRTTIAFAEVLEGLDEGDEVVLE